MANAVVTTQTSILHMIVSPISKLTTVWSPEVYIHGIPWKVEAAKNNDENSLAVYLRCANKDKSSTWKVAARATVQLLSFNNNNKNALKQNIEPFAFNPSDLAFGYSSFIEWDELLKAENKYVQDDKIKLKVKITAEDPNYVDRSILKFENIDKSCDCGSIASFRLTVSHVENLLIVCSPSFIVRGISWDLSVYKGQTSNLGIMLDTKESSKKVSCNVTMSVKLLSSEDDVVPIEKCATYQVQWPFNIRISDVITWDELLKPENGYVNDDSIILEVELKADKPMGDGPNVDSNSIVKRGRFECAICLEDIDSQDISTTPCCHLFCTVCITKVVKALNLRVAVPAHCAKLQFNRMNYDACTYLPRSKHITKSIRTEKKSDR